MNVQRIVLPKVTAWKAISLFETLLCGHGHVLILLDSNGVCLGLKLDNLFRRYYHGTQMRLLSRLKPQALKNPRNPSIDYALRLRDCPFKFDQHHDFLAEGCDPTFLLRRTLHLSFSTVQNSKSSDPAEDRRGGNTKKFPNQSRAFRTLFVTFAQCLSPDARNPDPFIWLVQ